MSAPPSDAPLLRDAPFLADPFVRLVLHLLNEDGEEARIVGGAVRDALLGLPIADIDMATTALPETVMARAEAAGLRAIPTGIEHGTVTLVGSSRVIEVTTLREDIETDGRHAVVRHGRDWEQDARRRDFTINALSVGLDGHVIDLVGGLADLDAGRVRFIGVADERIAEDRLRVLRFFRFHAAFGRGPLDPDGLSSSIRARHQLGPVSAERIGQEMRKLVVARGAAAVVAAMQEGGILPLLAAGVGDLAGFARLPELEDEAPSPPLRLVVLFGRVQEDIDRIVRRFRLGNQERDRMTEALAAAAAVADTPEDRDDALVYRRGQRAFIDGLLLAGARGLVSGEAVARRRSAARGRTVPVFPLSGRDVVDYGIGRGPAVGVLLRQLETWWIAERFAPGEQELRHRLQMMIASIQ